jgi:hypothetical protein
MYSCTYGLMPNPLGALRGGVMREYFFGVAAGGPQTYVFQQVLKKHGSDKEFEKRCAMPYRTYMYM